MSDHVAKTHKEEAMSKSSSQAGQPSWMSHWIKGNSKAESTVNNSSLIRDNDRPVDSKSSLAPTELKMDVWLSESDKGKSRDAGKILTGMVNEISTKKPGDFRNEFSSSSVPTLSLGRNTTNTSTIRTQFDQKFGHKAVSLALALGKEDTATDLSKLHENNLSSEKHGAVPRPRTYKKAGSTSCLLSHGSDHPDASRPVVVFEKHFSNDNFTSYGQENCKYHQKFSSFLVHETKMENDLSHQNGLHLQHGQSADKNFQAFFCKKQSQSAQDHATAILFPTNRSLSDIDPGKSYHSFPCSMHNVETMRICTTVDAVVNSPGGPHKISQRAHHFLFTKETCVNLSKGHQVLSEPTPSTPCEEKTFPGPFGVSPDVASHSTGVKIQPLWTSTDSEEKGNSGNPSTSKAGSRNEASTETDGMQVEAPKNWHSIVGMASSSSRKDNVDENSSPAACDSSTEKTGSKRMLMEIPDINEELPGLQPAVSSTDGTEPSTSRVHSLNANHLFACDEQTSRSARQDRPLGTDSSSRWIKRLKLNSSDAFGVGTKSSDMEEGSSPEKFNKFFNSIRKSNRESSDPELHKHHGKEQMELDLNVELLRNGGTSAMVSKKRNRSMMNGCSWIQRWCQQTSAAPPRNPEPLVICEPHSLKFGQEELAKKQFPSIAALALMGKAMNGSHSCEFRKRGSVVVWNTKEY